MVTSRSRHRAVRLAASLAALPVALVGAGPAAAADSPSLWHFEPGVGATHGADVLAARSLGAYGSGVTVAVIDTWVDGTDSTEFGGRVADGVRCLGGSADPAECTPGQKADACTHGTHVSGTVASADFGVAPAARILPVQVLTYDPSSGDCSGTLADVVAGIDYVVDGGHPRAQVINMSLGDQVPGLTQSSAVTAAVASAAAAGVVVAIAAGNSGLPFTDSYPNDANGVPDALLVAATGPTGQLAGYSNTGGSVSLAAPGGDTGGDVSAVGTINSCAGDGSDCILSTLPGGATGLMEGTSMACPHVAGAAALVLGRNPAVSRDTVVDALTSTAHPLAGAGHGLLDAAAAVAAVPTPGQQATGPTAATTTPPATHPVVGTPTTAGRGGSPATSSGSSPVAGSGVTTGPLVTPVETGPSVAPAEPGPSLPGSSVPTTPAAGTVAPAGPGGAEAAGPAAHRTGTSHGGPTGAVIGLGIVAALALAGVAAALAAGRRPS
ncbi:MAG TPA: S8 family serine peptidase [Acidimicrobiales bacterium]|nr:S8 family serine peptidase [Acidimicrobiales bacterium]